MTRTRRRRPATTWARAGVCVFALVAVAAGCASVIARDVDERPTVTVTLLEGERTGTPCDLEVTRGEGAPPDAAQRLAKLRLTADRPVHPRVLDDVATEWCAAHCADGFNLLRAEEEPGGGRTAIEVWVYRSVVDDAR